MPGKNRVSSFDPYKNDKDKVALDRAREFKRLKDVRLQGQNKSKTDYMLSAVKQHQEHGRTGGRKPSLPKLKFTKE